ncbi:MAG: response regulator, partial [Pseudomonadota bacterium]
KWLDARELLRANKELKEEIRNRRRLEEALRANEEKYRLVFDSSNDLLFVNWLVGSEGLGELLDVNESACRVLAYSKDELLMPSNTIFPEGSSVILDQARLDLNRDGHALFEIDVQAKDGTFIPMEFNSHLFSLNGLPTVLSVGRDISRRKETERALLRAKKAADRASRAKTEFLANMSHEIRTPMHGIIGITNLTLETDLNPEQRQNLLFVKSSAERLMSILNDILDLAKIEAGKLTLEPRDFDPREALEEAVRDAALNCRENEVELAVVIDPRTPRRARGDAARLRQVLFNLLDNAARFSKKGEIVASVEPGPDEEDGWTFFFQVRDQGIGIPPELQTEIFQPFSQVDPSSTREFGGSGLGLAISSSLVRMMGGEIWVDSEPGRGSTFGFSARLGRPRDRENPAARPDWEALKGTRVVVASPHAGTRAGLAGFLDGWGVAAALVEDLERLRAELAGGRAGLVFLDRDLLGPGESPGTGPVVIEPDLKGITLILLEKIGQDVSGADRFRELFLSKPFKEAEIAVVAARAMGIKAGESPRAEAPPPALRNILLAEDNPVNQYLTVRLLEKKGYKVRVAENGLEALRAWEEEQFNLILMDVQMPVMDGLAAAAEIRKKEAGGTARTPIVAMTAHAMKGDRERFLAAGMDDYLAKPIVQKDFLSLVERAGRSVDAGEPVPEEAPAALVWDEEELLERTGGDSDLIRELLGLFLSGIDDRLEELEKSLASSDWSALTAQAHALKGASANLSAKAFSAQALDLEKAGRDRDWPAARAALRNLASEAACFGSLAREKGMWG